MPYYKFKPWKVYGRYNTRLFKELLKKKNNKERQPFYIDPEIQAANIEIHNPNDPNFFKELSQEVLTHDAPKFLEKPRDLEHPLFKDVACYLFDGNIGLTDGIDEACAIIKAPKAMNFSENFFQSFLPAELFTDDFAEQVKNSIMHGERYNPTLERLPKKHDPILFWIRQPTLFGTPVIIRNNIIMHDLYRKVLLASASKNKSSFLDIRCNLNAYLSCFLPENLSGFKLPFVLRQQPYLTVQSEQLLTPLADASVVEATKSFEVPNIYPITPVVDLTREHIYNDTPVIPRSVFPNLRITTVFSTYMDEFREQNAANAIMNCFGTAVLNATRSGAIGGDKVLNRPILTKAIQLIDGKLDMVAVQLNTLDLSQSEGDIKNLVWVEKAAPLYTPKPFYENMDEVNDFNFETFKKFAAFLLYR